jgi:N-acyl-D-amino-acid deacylase
VDFDLVVRDGTLVDGTGAPARRADVGARAGRVVAVGDLGARPGAARTIDAHGRLVTPGFVDIHTHLDAQMGWDPLATSSCWHGVTSVVLGNCGVSFAPCRPEDRPYLARLMESVEDIPAEAILAGLPWNWETYGQFLDFLAAAPKGVNVGGMVGHCALRYQAMGERSMEEVSPSPSELAAMQEMVDEAMAGGALGFSTSRTLLHRVPDGRPVPGTFAPPEELAALARVLGRHGRGVLEVVPRLDMAGVGLEEQRQEVEWMGQASVESGRPVTFALAQTDLMPGLHRGVLGFVDQWVARGAELWPQTTPRGVGVLFSLASRTPFDRAGPWAALGPLGLEERLAVLADPHRRRELVEAAQPVAGQEGFFRGVWVLGPGEARYDFRPEASLWALAQAAGESVTETFVRLNLESRGQVVLSWPVLNQSLDAVEEMLSHPRTVLGLGDSGAHVGQIMDASLPTFYLSYWVRDRRLVPLEEGVRKLTSEPARLFGIGDRGVVAEGAWADLNVVDLASLGLPVPRFVHDLPGGAGRWVQEGRGIDYTVVNGQVFMDHGRHTGALAGQLLGRPAA